MTEADSQAQGARPVARGDRRQMTVMFCDIVGSTRISEQIDPEQMRELLLKYQDVAGGPVRRYDGHIAQYLGDGLLVYFGYPRAHEDAARRALLAGLEITAAVRALSPEIEARFGVPLDVRIGVHTGEVVIADMGGGASAVGPIPNIAARLQDLAEPNTVVTTGFTRDLTLGYFDFDDAGRSELRGVSEPMQIYRVTAATGASTRLQTGRTISPLVGRDAERSVLEASWQRTLAREVVRPIVLTGDAGMGKSRLVRFLRDRAERSGGACYEGACSPYRLDTPFFAFADLIEQACGVLAQDEPETRLSKLEQRLALNGMPEHAAGVVATLLGTPIGPQHQPLQLAPEAFRALAIDTLGQWLDRACAGDPVLMVIEDAHWADDSTLELIGRLADGRQRPGFLLLVTTRPDLRRQTWPDDAVEALTLQPLDEASRAEMLDWLIVRRELPDDLRGRLLDRSNGVPLFLEELARTYAGDEAASARGEQTVPSSLRDLLAERLERPGVDKELAQIIAAVGLEAPLALIGAVAGADQPALQQRLEGLVVAGIVEPDPAASASCRFRHALVRDAAYLSQLRSQRVDVHGRIAEAMEQGIGGSPQPEVLALHSAQAERWDRAAPYYIQAGARARGSGAELEAIRHFTEALACVAKLPEGQERDNIELMARLSRAGSYTATRGYAAPGVGSDLEAGLEICRKLGPSAVLLAALTSIWSFRIVAGDLAGSAEVLDEALEAVRQPELQQFLPELQICQGHQHFYAGRFPDALVAFQAGIPAYLERTHRGGASFWPLPNDPGVAGLSVMACAAWIAGEADLAWRSVDQAVALAESMPFPVGPFSVGYASVYGAYVNAIAGRHEAARTFAERAVAVGEEHGFALWQISGRIRLLHALGMLQPVDEVTLTAESLAAMVELWQSTGAHLFQTANYAALAEVYARAGETQKALVAIEAGLEGIARDECFHHAELLGLRAELRRKLAPGKAEEVAADLRLAGEIARLQGAPNFAAHVRARRERIEASRADVSG